MSSSGPRGCGTGANATGIGTVPWSATSFITSDNTLAAQANLLANSANFSNWLRATNFGFAIDSGATINGFLFEARKKYITAAPTDNAARAVKALTVGSTDRALAGAWASGANYYSHGGASDLWGDSWSPSDINATGFGFALSAKITGHLNGSAQVEYVRCTVYFTPAGSSIILAATHYAKMMRT